MQVLAVKSDDQSQADLQKGRSIQNSVVVYIVLAECNKGLQEDLGSRAEEINICTLSLSVIIIVPRSFSESNGWLELLI